jgi:hypothetical protein
MDRPKPGVALTILALIFVVVAVTSILKPFATGPDAGFMLLGFRTDGVLEAIVARVHAALMLGLAYGIWGLKRYALYFLLVYTPYVLLNLILFSLRYEWHPPGDLSVSLFVVIYALIALGVPGGTAYLLSRRRPELS